MINWNAKAAIESDLVTSSRTIRDGARGNNAKPSRESQPSGLSGRMTAIELKQSIDDCLGTAVSDVEHRINASLTSQHSSVERLAQQANAMAGKRLRPILVLLSARSVEALGNATFEQARRNLTYIASAAELVHMASLVHDDIMDQAESRRHQPTIHQTAGAHAALLLGDFLFTKGYATASSCGSTFPARKLAMAATQLCEGELRQQASANNLDLSVNEYLSIVGQKTASLCAVSCRLGAWQMGAPVEVQRCLHRFGEFVGLAFQVFDDWLDYWGSDQTGKTLGTDLAQLKPTLPLIKFVQSSSPATRQQLLTLASSGNSDLRAAAYEMIRQSDAGEKTILVAQRLVQRAFSALRDIPNCPAKRALEMIAAFSINRAT